MSFIIMNLIQAYINKSIVKIYKYWPFMLSIILENLSELIVPYRIRDFSSTHLIHDTCDSFIICLAPIEISINLY